VENQTTVFTQGQQDLNLLACGKIKSNLSTGPTGTALFPINLETKKAHSENVQNAHPEMGR